MNLHEYQAKQLFEHYGLPVKNRAVCQSVDEVDLVLTQLSGDKWAAMLVGVVKRVALN